MSNETRKLRAKTDKMLRMIDLIRTMLEVIYEQQIKLSKRVDDQHEVTGNIIKIIELDREITEIELEELKNHLEQDSVEMADDLTEQLDQLKNFVQSQTSGIDQGS